MIPWVREWHEKYNGESFTVASVHYPEFRHEEKLENVIAAAEELGVEYPIAIDNDGRTWRAYQQRFWPTRHLIDKDGRIRFKHIGEGAYEETEAAIQALIASD